ncbi:MAG: hypothetical protein LQ346_000487 [Caloplaca aetnensis]|nr:MAG: hypothetical protein LQ346_000487 [Caloplaca aetnensis]
MASNLVVIDASARRATIKTTPAKVLSDVLQEACSKLGADASRYGLKHNNKTLDLSNPIRLSGLSSGAKLELVQLSRSPSVVSVALQLPEDDAQGVSGGRLIEKFPSNTTLWLILRRFESLAPHRNYTQRAKPKTAAGDPSAGRLYHEAPVLNIMGRELSSFTELQKTLAQLGFNSGSVLLRLNFRASDTPVEVAMEQIDSYFKSVEGESKAGAHATSMTASQTVPNTDEPVLPEDGNGAKSPAEPASPPLHEDKAVSIRDTPQQTNPPIPKEPSILKSTTTGSSQRAITVFKPSSSATPLAAQKAFREADFEPTLSQAQRHQARLQTEGRNRTLLSDRELAQKDDAKAKKVAEIKDIRVRVKLPDEHVLEMTLSSADTAEMLYDNVKESLNSPQEPFLLQFPLDNGKKRTVPQNSKEKLGSDLGMSGNTLVIFHWDEGVSAKSRNTPLLKEHLREHAEVLKIPDVPELDAPEEPAVSSTTGKRLGSNTSERKIGKPKWAKSLFKS